MNASEFVKLFKKDKDSFSQNFKCTLECPKSLYLDASDTGFSEAQMTAVNAAVDRLLTDVYYSSLLGLDGCGSIGDVQQEYKIYAEDGALISDGGEIESEAFEQFHAGN